MTLSEIETILEELALRHQNLNTELLTTLLLSAGWEDKNIKEAITLFKKGITIKPPSVVVPELPVAQPDVVPQNSEKAKEEITFYQPDGSEEKELRGFGVESNVTRELPPEKKGGIVSAISAALPEVTIVATKEEEPNNALTQDKQVKETKKEEARSQEEVMHSDVEIKTEVKEIDKEIADLREETSEIELKWKNEKETVSGIKSDKKQLEELRREADTAEAHADLSKAAEIRYGKIPAIEKDLDAKSKRLKKLQSSRRILKEEITENDIATVVSKWTGVPVTRMLESEADKLSRMEEVLKKRIVGQDEAVGKISDTIKRSRAGISDPLRPIGSFLFLGPTGVGKTELTKALAEFLFDDDKALIRVDMSEFMEKHSVSKLIGAPAGYVGYEEGGNLTEQIRHRPYSVVLFDEIEKAHPEVFNILLQVLDNGRLTDAKGRAANFRNTVIIMTSNIGSQYIDRMQRIGFTADKTEKADYDDAKSKVMEALKEHFRPEFLNRLDDVILFEILSKEAISEIVKLQIEIVQKRLSEKEIKLGISPAAFEHLAMEGYSPQYGARPLKRLIQNKILTPIASLIIGKGISKGGTIWADWNPSAGADKKGEFTFEIKKGKRGETFVDSNFFQEKSVRV
jgi:ATP-dependent Clp protease ATP-binding subunit ClpB